MPALMMLLLFYTAAIYYISSGGPLAPNSVGDAGNCRVNWVTNLFLVHNLANTDELVSDQMSLLKLCLLQYLYSIYDVI